jgi:hypothetical protein
MSDKLYELIDELNFILHMYKNYNIRYMEIKSQMDNAFQDVLMAEQHFNCLSFGVDSESENLFKKETTNLLKYYDRHERLQEDLHNIHFNSLIPYRQMIKICQEKCKTELRRLSLISTSLVYKIWMEDPIISIQNLFLPGWGEEEKKDNFFSKFSGSIWSEEEADFFPQFSGSVWSDEEEDDSILYIRFLFVQEDKGILKPLLTTDGSILSLIQSFI